MKNIILIIAIILFSSLSYGQSKRESIHAEKMTFIITEMGLTTKEAEQFSPIYDAYWKERKSAHKLSHIYLKDISKAVTDEEKESTIDTKLDLFLESLKNDAEIQKKYKPLFLQVVSAKKLAAMYLAEEEFRIKMICKLKQHVTEKKGNQNLR